MKKTRLLKICFAGSMLLLGLALFLGKDMYAAIWNAYEDREHVSVQINNTDDLNILCVHDIETEEIAVQLAFRDITKDIEGLKHRYRLDISCRNKGETQYRYRVELNGYSNSLVTDGDDAEFASGSNYSFSDSSGGMDVEFAPAEKQGCEGTAGTVEYRFFRNLPAPTTGSVTVIVSVYLPYFDLKIHSFTQELRFPMTEP